MTPLNGLFHLLELAEPSIVVLIEVENLFNILQIAKPC